MWQKSLCNSRNSKKEKMTHCWILVSAKLMIKPADTQWIRILWGFKELQELQELVLLATVVPLEGVVACFFSSAGGGEISSSAAAATSFLWSTSKSMVSAIWDDGFFTCSSECGSWDVVVVVCRDSQVLSARGAKADEAAPGMKGVGYAGCKSGAPTVGNPAGGK